MKNRSDHFIRLISKRKKLILFVFGVLIILFIIALLTKSFVSNAIDNNEILNFFEDISSKKDSYINSLIPVFTLLLGYLLNVWVGSIESRREVNRRRITQKEKAYSEISAKLHELYEKKRMETLKETSSIAGVPIWGEPDINIVPAAYNELMMIVFKNNLYLPHEMIQDLLDLKYDDFRGIVKDLPEDKVEKIKYLENHADEMWKNAKNIIDKMRKDLGLGEYPDEMLKLWR